jgi:hypothetical protein
MRIHLYAIFWTYSLAIATPTRHHNVEDLIHEDVQNSIPRNEAHQALAALERRVTTIPNLVPAATVNLETDSTGTTQMVSPLRDGGTIGTVATTATPKSVAGADPTTAAGDRATAAGNAKSTSSKGGASSSAVPMVGMILLGLLGL